MVETFMRLSWIDTASHRQAQRFYVKMM